MEFLGKEWRLLMWNGERLLQDVAIDTETTLIEGYMIPNLVTFQATDFDTGRIFFVRKEDLPRFFNLHSSHRLIFHNAAFDLEVINKAFEDLHLKFPLFEYIESGDVYDTAILYRLFMLAQTGDVPRKFNLALLAKEFLFIELDKDEDIRLTFSQFLVDGQTQWEEMSDRHKEYAAKDSIVTHALYRNLMTRISRWKSESDMTHGIQLAGDLVLKRMERRGIGMNLPERNKMMDELLIKSRYHSEVLATYGWVQGLAGIKERFEWIMTEFLKLKLPLTETGEVSAAEDDLMQYAGIPFVDHYIAYHKTNKIINFIKAYDTDRVHPKYNLLMDTGRTSSEKPNLQNVPRGGGVRELFVPAPDHKFLIVDYSFIELCTLAQTAYSRYGFSNLRDIINAGKDPHRAFAAEFLKKPLEEVTKQERQFAKAANFGYPGGLGPDKFMIYARDNYGVNVTRKEAVEVREHWFMMYPELKLYMDDTSNQSWTITGRVRGEAQFCASKNTPFQGLAADGAKLALFNLEKAGFHPVAFIHDEIICEEPVRNHKKRFDEMKQIMIDSMKMVVPDVNVGVEGHIMDKWEKK